MYMEGAAILYTTGHYDRNLAFARLGILPFFWIACLAVFLWARHLFGPAVAALAVLLFSTLPPILAHAGLATTDMALAAMFGISFCLLLRWMGSPTLVRTGLFGVVLGLAVLSKFSLLVFLPAAAAFAAVWYAIRDRTSLAALRTGLARRLLLCAIVLAIAAVIVWSGYRFSFGPTHFGFAAPAPGFFSGIDSVRRHNASGHPSYLLGKRTMSGFWYYYPVVLSIKTPLGYLVLLVIGAVLCLRSKRADATIPLAFCAGIMLVTTFSRINIGVRHVLPLYLAFSIMAAYAAERMLKAREVWAPVLACLLIAWSVISSALAHPDYIPYFNEIVSGPPENWVVDSDLDWGQDMKRLSARLRELGAQRVSFSPLIVAHLERVHGFPPMQDNDPVNPDAGWNAISPTVWKTTRLGLYESHPEIVLWPDRTMPNERVGSILLYYFAPVRTPNAAQP
jgi:4-amino-4-deoxy-L-arabinose transferase-like glycosyltransferase